MNGLFSSLGSNLGGFFVCINSTHIYLATLIPRSLTCRIVYPERVRTSLFAIGNGILMVQDC